MSLDNVATLVDYGYEEYYESKQYAVNHSSSMNMIFHSEKMQCDKDLLGSKSMCMIEEK